MKIVCLVTWRVAAIISAKKGTQSMITVGEYFVFHELKNQGLSTFEITRRSRRSRDTIFKHLRTLRRCQPLPFVVRFETAPRSTGARGFRTVQCLLNSSCKRSKHSPDPDLKPPLPRCDTSSCPADPPSN